MNQAYQLADLINTSSSSELTCLLGQDNLYIKLKIRKLGIEKYFTEHCDVLDERLKANYINEMAKFDSILLRLVTNNIIPNKDDKAFYRGLPKTLKKHCELLFGCGEKVKSYQKDSFIIEYLNSMKEVLVEGRKAEMKKRLLLAAEELLIDKKYFCLFNTLTVKPDRFQAVFSKGSKEWRRYIENLDNLFGIASYQTVREAKKARKAGFEYHQYFAVIEKGGKGGRLHIHVLHMFRDLPISFKDPNYGYITNRNEIAAMKELWSHNGYSTPIPIRFGQDDAWGSRTGGKGWIMPAKYVEGVLTPQVCKPPRAICNYVAKYMLLPSNCISSPINGTGNRYQSDCIESQIFSVELSAGYVYCFGYLIDNHSANSATFQGGISLSFRKYESELSSYKPRG